MSDIQSLLKDLQAEVDRSKARRDDGQITSLHVESLIRKYSINAPGDTSDQPGNWQIRGGNVDAIQHDGTYACARKIRAWIEERGGKSEWLGTYDQEADKLRIRLFSPREPNIVGPGWWVVRTADGIFFAVSETDFHIIYVPRDVHV
jgi:hypothetical protein